MKVWISVHGRFHAFDLARELQRRNVLGGITTTYPQLVARRFLPAGVPIRSAAWLELMRRASDMTGMPLISDFALARHFARFSARRIGSRADIFVGWSGASLEAIEAARRAGMRVVIERGSTHIAHQAAILAEEYSRLNLQAAVDTRLVDRELAEYAAADAVAVPSRFAAATFTSRGIPASKLIINPYGADVARFAKPADRRRGSKVRILFVGTVGVRKGVVWLLRAFAKVKDRASLHLVGPVEGGLDEVLRREALEGVTIHGPLRHAHLDAAYDQADIFCLPSLEEGFPLSLLQAMAAALPVVATPETGIEDAVIHGREGLVVPSRNVRALADALEALVDDPSRRVAMGEAGRRLIGSGFSWSDYGDRAVRAFQRLLGKEPSPSSLACDTVS